ncbi:MAG TPA: HD domain-containing phosphohydrolase [Feifaniaceae bacterium]|nr:HD domain-containing phosphohydrolase [Feifaniaceae bacterium]
MGPSVGGIREKKHTIRWISLLASICGALLFVDALLCAYLLFGVPEYGLSPPLNAPRGAGPWPLLGAALVLLCAALLALPLILRSRKRNEKSALSEPFLKTLDRLPYGIMIGSGSGEPLYRNPALYGMLGRTPAQMEGARPEDFFCPEDAGKAKAGFEALRREEIEEYSLEAKAERPSGPPAWLRITIAPLPPDFFKVPLFLYILEDITPYRDACRALTESERSKAVLLSHLPGLAYRCENDEAWTMRFVSDGCFALTGCSPLELTDNMIAFNDLIKPAHKDTVRRERDRALALDEPFRCEYEITAKDGESKWVLETGQGVLDETGAVTALEGIIIDITEQKKRGAQIQYMHDHDILTGLHNRIYFEAEKRKLNEKRPFSPFSIIIADINGLKLINDALGYSRGDELINATAGLIRGRCPGHAVLARTGGDEFSILLPETGLKDAAVLVREIMEALEQYNKSNSALGYDISVSFGFAVKQREEENVEEVAKTAEDYLNSRKLLTRKSSHNSILSYVMATIYARSQETEAHAKRLSKLARCVGMRMGLTQSKLDQLELFAMLHDIGKIGVDDRILNKPAELSGDEWVYMRRHPEIGCRIATASPELKHIALLILTHHERYDGAGYPVGLKGEEIPLLSRILAVVDAYDAMTEERIYRKAMSREEALEELNKNAGTQFDPYIAALFIDCIKEGSLPAFDEYTEPAYMKGTGL